MLAGWVELQAEAARCCLQIAAHGPDHLGSLLAGNAVQVMLGLLKGPDTGGLHGCALQFAELCCTANGGGLVHR